MDNQTPIPLPYHVWQQDISNRVLSPDWHTSSNFFQSDLILRHFLRREISPDGFVYIYDKLDFLGDEAAGRLSYLAATADRHTPQLIKRNPYGETVNRIDFHPAYWAMVDIAVKSEMFRLKWFPPLRQRFQEELHRLGFAAGFLFSTAEAGVYCPLCMTDGAARLIDRYCSDEDKERLLPHIFTDNSSELYTGAMFLTEKTGGSDVGANRTLAQWYREDYYALNGEKWFCSNVNAQVIFALARTNVSVSGTAGLSLFLVEPYLADGRSNPIEIVRLKDKLGVRSMASAECLLQNTLGKIVGEAGQGFKLMADMINLSRIYNSVSAIGLTRRALAECYQFLTYRTTFGSPALQHALIRLKLWELGAKYAANFYLTMHTVKVLDLADNGRQRAAQLLRLLTPMLKKITAENAVYSIRECMELMGGMGYIEDSIMPRLLRDALVLPIWEGASNIMILDMLRAAHKSEAVQVICEDIYDIFYKNGQLELIESHLQPLVRLSKQLQHYQERDLIEATAQKLFERLTILYQIALLFHYNDSQSNDWIRPALDYYLYALQADSFAQPQVPTQEIIENLMGWKF